METFLGLLAVSPVARSGNSLLGGSRGSRHTRHGLNSLRGDGCHHPAMLSRPLPEKKVLFCRRLLIGVLVSGGRQIVKFDICGGIYNQSHFRSHKRLSDGKRGKSTRASKGEAGDLEAIVSTFQQLPEEKKTEVLHRLRLALTTFSWKHERQ